MQINIVRRITAFVGLTLLLGAVLAHAQDKSVEDTIKVETKLVSIPTIVSDRDGRYIPNLTLADFAIFQDGKEVPVDFFASTEEPINVAILVDTSQSTRSVLGDIKKAANNFIKAMTLRDQAMVVSFDFETHILSPLTSNKDQLKKAVHAAEIPEKIFGTTMRDAVVETVKRQFRGINGRKAIILLTDGKDHGSEISSSELLYSMQESDVMIYPVYFSTGEAKQRRPNLGRGGGGVFGGGGGMGRRGGGMGRGGGGMGRFPPPSRPQNPRGAAREENNEEAMAYLKRLSDTTAGRFYESKKSKFDEIFSLIADELRHQYRLGFYPSEDANAKAVHQLKVRVARPDVVVRARGSYRTQEKTN